MPWAGTREGCARPGRACACLELVPSELLRFGREPPPPGRPVGWRESGRAGAPEGKAVVRSDLSRVEEPRASLGINLEVSGLPVFCRPALRGGELGRRQDTESLRVQFHIGFISVPFYPADVSAKATSISSFNSEARNPSMRFGPHLTFQSFPVTIQEGRKEGEFREWPF